MLLFFFVCVFCIFLFDMSHCLMEVQYNFSSMSSHSSHLTPSQCLLRIHLGSVNFWTMSRVQGDSEKSLFPLSVGTQFSTMTVNTLDIILRITRTSLFWCSQWKIITEDILLIFVFHYYLYIIKCRLNEQENNYILNQIDL